MAEASNELLDAVARGLDAREAAPVRDARGAA
jgi:hypothetical protein